MQDEDFVIHIFGAQSAMSQRGADVTALEDIALAIDVLSKQEIVNDASKAQGCGRVDAADVVALLCRLRLRECILKVGTGTPVLSCHRAVLHFTLWDIIIFFMRDHLSEESLVTDSLLVRWY